MVSYHRLSPLTFWPPRRPKRPPRATQDTLRTLYASSISHIFLDTFFIVDFWCFWHPKWSKRDPQIVPKSIPNRSQETQKGVLERTSENSKKTFGIQLPKPCKSIKNRRFFIVFCISTLFKMMANMERNVIQN